MFLDLVRLARIWSAFSDFVRFGWILPDFVGYGRSWLGFVGFGGI